MIYALLLSALAADSFDPLPAQHTLSGKTYEGILVDEATFTELGRLRVLTRSQEERLSHYEDFRSWGLAHTDQSLTRLRDECDVARRELVQTHSANLAQMRKQRVLGDLGFGAGLVVGAAITTGVTLGLIRAYELR